MQQIIRSLSRSLLSFSQPHSVIHCAQRRSAHFFSLQQLVQISRAKTTRAGRLSCPLAFNRIYAKYRSRFSISSTIRPSHRALHAYPCYTLQQSFRDRAQVSVRARARDIRKKKMREKVNINFNICRHIRMIGARRDACLTKIDANIPMYTRGRTLL